MVNTLVLTAPILAFQVLLFAQAATAQGAPKSPPDGLRLTLEKADVQTVVGGLARQNQLNLIGADRLTGTVTAYLSNVTPTQALEAVLKSKGFCLRQSGEIWEIVPEEEERLEQEREKEREKAQRREQEREQERAKAQRDSQTREVLLREFPIRYADLDRAAAALVPSVLPEASQISKYPESGLLIVKATGAQMSEVERVLRLIDVPIPQILIRAKIFEVSQKRADDLGVEWRRISLKSPTNLRMDLSQPISRPSFMWGYVRGDVELSLEALVEKKAADILSEPQVTATNNQPAVIKVTDRIPVITRTLQVVNEQTITTDEVTFEEAGLSLEVTPRVVGGDHVFLKLYPSVRELVGFTDTTPPQPIINSREATTEVMIQSGTWLVIGGLMRNTVNANKRKVPLLGSIPLLGLPFRSRTGNSEKSNLLILVSATILDDESVEQQTSNSTQELEKLRGDNKKDWVGLEAARKDLAGQTEAPGPGQDRGENREVAQEKPADGKESARKKRWSPFRRKTDR